MQLAEIDLPHARIVDDIMRGVLDEHAAIDEHGERVGEAEHEVHVVLDQDEGHRAGKCRNNVENLFSLGFRHAGSRLVEQ